VNIIVAPQFTKDSEVKPVTIDGDATLHQSVDEETGIMTIKLSDISSDVTIKLSDKRLNFFGPAGCSCNRTARDV
jgi:hypothetical protein